MNTSTQTIPANSAVTLRDFRAARKSILRLYRSRRGVSCYTLDTITSKTGVCAAVALEVMNDLVATGIYAVRADGWVNSSL